MSEINQQVNHIAIIMDGNGRWAQDKGQSRSYGHQKGAENVLDIVKASGELGVKNLTLFAFSSENWNRPKDEVEHLMGLMREYIEKQFKNLIEKKVRVRAIGDLSKLPDDLQQKIKEAEETSKDNDAITVTLAVSYGGRDDIVHACKNIASSVEKGDISVSDINEDLFSKNLYTLDAPYPEILIRTGGEYRISNFLLWQMAYSELFFSEKYWPEFTKKDLENIITEYKTRNRRFGKV